MRDRKYLITLHKNFRNAYIMQNSLQIFRLDMADKRRLITRYELSLMMRDTNIKFIISYV